MHSTKQTAFVTVVNIETTDRQTDTQTEQLTIGAATKQETTTVVFNNKISHIPNIRNIQPVMKRIDKAKENKNIREVL